MPTSSTDLMPARADGTVVLEGREDAYRGFFRIGRLRFRHSTYAGGEMAVTREVFERGQSVAVIIYDPDRDLVLLVEQVRAGAVAAGLDGWKAWMLEPVAGMVETGDVLEDRVVLEAQEEAGVAFHSPLLGPVSSMPSPGGSSEIVHLYIGLADLSSAGGDHGLASEGEDVRAIVLPRAAAWDAALSYPAASTMTLLGLAWLDRKFPRRASRINS